MPRGGGAQKPENSDRGTTRRVGRADLTAGITNAVTNIPDAMANAVLAGLNPIHGLYAIMVGTPAASLSTGSHLMTVAVTGALALIVGDTLAAYPPGQRVEPLVILTLLVAVIQVALGLLRAGSLVRFVSNSVLRGFLTGVAVNIVLSQISSVTGYESAAGGKLARTLDTLLHPLRIDPWVLGVGVVTVAVILLVEHTPAKDFAFLVALLASSLVVGVFGLDVPVVRSLSEIPSKLPSIHVPDLRLMPTLVVPALAIALVGLIQAAGVSKSTPNPDGTYPNLDRDFVGQGIGNAASGLFTGMPIGGSLSSTALVVQLGARSRFANFIVGPIIAAVVLFFSGAVELIPLTTLAAMLIVVGVRAVDVPAIQTVWQTSIPARTVMLVTFVSVLVIPVQYAVMLGVALAVVQHVYSASLDARVVVLTPGHGGLYAEGPAPEVLPSEAVTVLDIYGSVFYAGADVIAGLLPTAHGAFRPAVILRLRGRTDVGSTFLGVLDRYRREVEASQGMLMLAGVSPQLRQQLQRTGLIRTLGDDRVFDAQPTLTESLGVAIATAEAWLCEEQAEGTPSA